MLQGPQRPNPEHLLAQVRAEERQQGRGRLKVFLGYAAGVGKTFAMLEAARQRKAEGVDVVAAYVETHGRPETEALLAGLESLPRRSVTYRDARLEEFDLDGALARRPALALVDELAHTNAPGSRHPKRYQDVEELLAAGIDVYTTLNIQHLESANDVVAQITGIVVRETLPDRIIDEADEIELVDLPPDELLQRLREGKVYVPDQAARAIERFFRKGNLTALREMTLRRAALRIDGQMRAYMQMRSIAGPWPVAERLLVCVSPSPLNERLVRATRRLADELSAEWFALYVETPAQSHLSPEDRDRVGRNLQLAEQLGGKVATRQAEAVAEAVVAFGREHNVTKIIAGKPLRPRWVELLRGSVVDQIIRLSGLIDVYVISGTEETPRKAEHSRGSAGRPWRQYLQSVGLVAAASVIGWPIHIWLEPANLVMLYLTAVVIAALYLGRGPAILASVLSVLVFDFFFIAPRGTLVVADTQYLLTFLGLLVVGLVISTLAARVRDQVEAGRHRERRTAALYSLSRDLAAAGNLEGVLQAVVAHVGETFGRAAVVLLPEGEGLRPGGATPGLALGEDELAVASWAFEHATPAGEGTDTLPATSLRYLPLVTARGVVGVLGVRPAADPVRDIVPEERRLLEAFASQAAIAIERTHLADQASQVELLSATEKLQTALLNSISHDLRTPLASITGVLSSLRHDKGSSGRAADLDEATRDDLVETAWGEADRLNRLVGNLLDMTRLEAGALRVNKEPCDLTDVVGAVLTQLEQRAANREVVVDVPPELPLVPMDFVLIAQVLANLLDNGLKYSSPDTPVEVAARLVGNQLELTVADRGSGIPTEELGRVFDKFHRVQRTEDAVGTGLGLAISKGIAEAHGGSIEAVNRPGGGTVIRLTLPLDPRAASGTEAAP
jgi:two-component system, OmpR family, sensor histidine kinase KdpD